MGHWPLATGDSLVVPSRAQVNLPGPCDRSFQTTPLTMSSAGEAYHPRDAEPGGCVSRWQGSLQPPVGPPEFQSDARRLAAQLSEVWESTTARTVD